MMINPKKRNAKKSIYIIIAIITNTLIFLAACEYLIQRIEDAGKED